MRAHKTHQRAGRPAGTGGKFRKRKIAKTTKIMKQPIKTFGVSMGKKRKKKNYHNGELLARPPTGMGYLSTYSLKNVPRQSRRTWLSRRSSPAPRPRRWGAPDCAQLQRPPAPGSPTTSGSFCSWTWRTPRAALGKECWTCTCEVGEYL